ncbi:hypothetical protein [Nocardia transvalensis]|uniref:hypothetical protein n=1 Tax=Nocardia transvalensis TaxID=37333 RepID=UPI001893B919|nr:hypothetical protein [Nocardia transvalensis]MBF6333613.1 hypothetical protein [Nocardia transvalensis]
MESDEKEQAELAAAMAARDAGFDAAAGALAGYVTVELIESVGGRGVMWLPVGDPADPIEPTPDHAERAGRRHPCRPRAIGRAIAELRVLGSQTTVRATVADEQGADFYLAIAKVPSGYVLNEITPATTPGEAARGHRSHPDVDAAFGVVAAHVVEPTS